ncbi:MAG: metallophosphoesterase [Pseudomonadota bacterium]|nr:metallophosphoesterase [Pseudomonadota bacterium]
MNIQILSDVHLEFGPLEVTADRADVLVAAGDIGVGCEGLDWLEQFSCPVIYVGGNHEYWHHDLSALEGELRDRTRGSNIEFLENRSVTIGDCRFLGCTLWTDFSGADELEMAQVFLAMNDFRYISVGLRGMIPEDIIERNVASRAWLREELSRPHDGHTVVVTHHAPLLQSWFRNRGQDPIRYAYCNELNELLSDNDIDLWIHGHIHDPVDYVVSDVRVVGNPRGYHAHREVRGFEQEKIVVV